MTTFKSKLYCVDKDPPYKFVTIGVTLITVETYTVIQDERAIELAVEDEVVYISVPYELVHRISGGADWNAIAKLIEEQEGYRRTHWKIMSVWACVPSHIADEIF